MTIPSQPPAPAPLSPVNYVSSDEEEAQASYDPQTPPPDYFAPYHHGRRTQHWDGDDDDVGSTSSAAFLYNEGPQTPVTVDGGRSVNSTLATPGDRSLRPSPNRSSVAAAAAAAAVASVSLPVYSDEEFEDEEFVPRARGRGRQQEGRYRPGIGTGRGSPASDDESSSSSTSSTTHPSPVLPTVNSSMTAESEAALHVSRMPLPPEPVVSHPSSEPSPLPHRPVVHNPPAPPPAPASNNNNNNRTTPTLEPYVGKLERFELFSTSQCYYLVACDKHSTSYRVMKMDRTLIERTVEEERRDEFGGGGGGAQQQQGGSGQGVGGHGEQSQRQDTGSAHGSIATHPPGDGKGGEAISGGGNSAEQQPQSQLPQQQQHGSNKPVRLRRLSEFISEDPHVYTQEEIQDMLDMIHDGNRFQRSGGGGGSHHHHTTHHDGSASTGGSSASQSGGLKPIAKAYGIVGFIRFLDCYYLTLITKRAKVGSIGGNGVYSIKQTETFPLKPAERSSNPSGSSAGDNPGNDPSSMLLSMWNRGKRSVGLGLTNREIAELRYQGLYQVVDLTKNFFFSYTYDITRSLQENFLAMTSQPFPPPPFKDMYAWNFFLTRELEECTSSLTGFHWVLPIVHGAFIQRKLNDYGRSLNLILLARRSRHFAGTRYLKRGVSDRGKVANDVEHEQITHDETTSASSGTFSSFLQVRGSIPTYWTQESSVTMPKPPIELNRVDPTYHATRAHFEDLLKRYGSPIVVVDLVKQSEKREREVRVGNEYRHAIDYLNTSIDTAHKIRYCALDYSHISKHRNLNVSTSLNEVATWAVNQTGFFCSAPRWKIVDGGDGNGDDGGGGGQQRVEPFFDEDNAGRAAFLTHHLGVPVFPMEQKGVLRTNCIDCLDRTNVAQFSAGVEALGQQLVVMGIRSSAKLDPSSNIVRMLIDMYVEIGDHIALQYGGSEAHKKVATAGSASNIQGPMGKHKELLTSIRRYYSNAFTDRLKQDAMNLFLGYYIPLRHTVPLWEMENDYYLHNFHVKAGRGSLQSMKAYQRTFAVDWSDDEDDVDPSAGARSERDVSISPLVVRERKRIVNSADHHNPRLGSDESSRTRRTLAERVESRDGRAPQQQQHYESFRIARVRKRCKAQNDALSVWWRVAIQSYIQQRMWMQLGRAGPSESLLPSRFERLYQPEKLAQFDKFFARSWATPVRVAHSAQHSQDDEAEKGDFCRKNVSPLRAKGWSSLGSEGKDVAARVDSLGDNFNNEVGDRSIQDFVKKHGFKSTISPSLTQFIKPHAIGREPRGRRAEKETSLSYVGTLKEEKEPCKEYIKYAEYSRDPSSFPKDFRPEAREEFTRCLYETSLDSDDVEGIRKLAESAHIGREIRTGPYRGLSQNDSATQVTTRIQEQFNTLGSMRDRGEVPSSLPGVDMELRRRGVSQSAVREAVIDRWDRFAKAEAEYAEIIDTSSLGCRRSDLTSENSMRLYCSFFDESTPLSRLDMTYMLGEQASPHGTSSSSLSYNPRSGGVKPPIPGDGAERMTTRTGSRGLASKAAKLGIPISACADVSSSSHSLFSSDGGRRAPAGFEQINEDLFARKDNKFMVFNGAGVDSWHGTHPKTKVHGIEEDFMVG